MKQGISPAVAVVVVLIVVIIIGAIGYFVFMKPKAGPAEEPQADMAPPAVMAGEDPTQSTGDQDQAPPEGSSVPQ